MTLVWKISRPSSPTLLLGAPSNQPVILSEAGTSRSEVPAESKDPYSSAAPLRPQGILPVSHLGRGLERSAASQSGVKTRGQVLAEPPAFSPGYRAIDDYSSALRVMAAPASTATKVFVEPPTFIPACRAADGRSSALRAMDAPPSTPATVFVEEPAFRPASEHSSRGALAPAPRDSFNNCQSSSLSTLGPQDVVIST